MPQSAVSPCPLSRLARSASLAPLGAGSLPRSTAPPSTPSSASLGLDSWTPRPSLQPSFQCRLRLLCRARGMEVLLQAGNLRVQCVFSLRCDVPSPSSTAPPPAPRSQQPPPPAVNAPCKRPRPLGVEVEGRQRREAAHWSRVRESPTHALSSAPAPLAHGEARSATAAQPPGHALRCTKFMLKEEIDKSVTQLLRPDPKLLNAE